MTSARALAASALGYLDAAELMAASGLEPDDWQRAYLSSSAPRILLNCSRQSGKSTSTGYLAMHQALTYDGSLTLIISPGLRQSGLLFDKVMEAYRAAGSPLEAEKQTALQLHLANGSRVIALPGTEETVRGFSAVDLCIFDEAARVSDVLYYSIRPMLAVSGGRLVALSTPWGRRGWFYDEWSSKRAWDRYEVPATRCPRIGAEFLAEERQALGEWWFSQEYLCEFRDQVDQFFDSEAIDRAFVDEVAPLFSDRLEGKAHMREEIEPLWSE